MLASSLWGSGSDLRKSLTATSLLLIISEGLILAVALLAVSAELSGIATAVSLELVCASPTDSQHIIGIRSMGGTSESRRLQCGQQLRSQSPPR